MTEVLHSPSHFPSSPRTSNTLFHSQSQFYDPNPNHGSSPSSPIVLVVEGGSGSSSAEGGSEIGKGKHRREKVREELSLLTLAVAVLRKSLVACKVDTRKELSAMDIGWPTNVRHVAHVTYDKFNGFSGLPVEFEPEVTRAPSASTSVFGVSTESMQLSYDTRGNCVPNILVLMQRRLYAQGGLQAEGIFRINAENSREEFVRDQLNRGIIPDDIDVHCLAGLIKAWFREMPTGVLDSLSPEQVMQSESEEECSELVKVLPSTEACLLDWVINLMADVVQEETFNKMNAHNIAMVFAPNMTQTMDPVTAITYTVQVIDILKSLITKKLREREESQTQQGPITCSSPSNESGHQSPSQLSQIASLEDYLGDNKDRDNNSEQLDSDCEDEPRTFNNSTPIRDDGSDDSLAEEAGRKFVVYTVEEGQTSSVSNGNFGGNRKGFVNDRCELMRTVTTPVENVKVKKGVCNLSRMSSRIERIETWR